MGADLIGLSSHDIVVALDRVKRLFDVSPPIRRNQTVEFILGYDSVPLPAEQVKSWSAAGKYLEEHGLKDAPSERQLATLLEHLGITDVKGLVYPIKTNRAYQAELSEEAHYLTWHGLGAEI